MDEAEAVRRRECHRAMRLVERVRLRWAFIVSALVMNVFELAAFILWQVRAHSNLSALGSVGLRYGSTSSVVWWIAPIAVLWKPLGGVQEIWFAIVSPLERFLIALSINIVADGMQIALVRRVALRQPVLERKRPAAVAKAEGAGEPVVDVDELLIRVKCRPDAAVFAGGGFEPRATEAKGPAN